MKKFENSKLTFKKFYVIFFLCLIALFLCFFILITLFVFNDIKFKLRGSNEINIELQKKFNDPGFIAKICKFSKCDELSNDVSIESNVDTSTVGNYKITYTLSYKNTKKQIIRKVNVIDSEPPKITLIGDDKVYLCPNQKYKELGFSAYDNYDGDLTNKVLIKNENHKIIYRVTDSSDNLTEITRDLIFTDNEKPFIKLKGKSTIKIIKGSSYHESGVVATDNCDGSISNNVIINNKVDINTPGNYELIYTIEDSSGNKSKITRKVIVEDKTVSDFDLYSKYLTSYIKEKNYNVSVGYLNLDTNKSFYYNDTTVYYGASLIKTLDALYVYENMEINDNLRNLVKATISVSENKSHFKLVEMIGKQNLKNYGLSLGAKYTLSGGDLFGNTSVNDQIIYMKKLYNFIIDNNELGPELKSYFINNHYNYLTFDGAPTILHKYGYYSFYFHDVGIVLDESPYIIVILSTEAKKDFKIITDISKKIYELNNI